MHIRNKTEFKAVFNQYYNPLCNFLMKYTNDDILIEDIVQDVFLGLWKNRKDHTISSDIKSYLFQAVKHKAFEHSRSRKSYEKHLNAFNESSQLSADEDELANRLLKLEKIYQSLRHLPPKCREVFELHKYNGLTYAEIAQTLGISEKTVEGHMLKAIKKLRELLAN